MKPGLRAAALLPVLMLVLAARARTSGEESAYLVLPGEQGPVAVHRSWRRLLAEAGLAGDSVGREARVAALAAALAAGPSPAESARGVASLFPAATLDSVELDGARVTVRLTLPQAFLDSLDFQRNDAIVHAFSTTFDQIPGVLELELWARAGPSGSYSPLDSYVPLPPPAPTKPHELQSPAAAGQPGAPGQAQPPGALGGKSVFINGSHGWYYSSTLDDWLTQRPNRNDIVEDFINAEAVNQYLVHYLWNAGAGVYTCRERDMNVNEVIVDNGDPGYSDSAGWATSTSAPGYYGVDYRVAPASPDGGEEATWTPDLPAAGYYGVYVWYHGAAENSTDAEYTVHHAGGDTVIVQNQQRDGYTWKYLGKYYFDPADPEERRRLTLSNRGSDPASLVIADAARFGGGMGSIPDGGRTSGRPRWEESGRYFAEFMGCPSCGTSTVSAMPRYAKWENEAWEDSVYISWHTNAPNPLTGTSTYIYTDGGVPNSVELQDFIHAELINDIRMGYDPAWTDRGQHTADFGEVNPANNDEMPAVLIELAFHDTPSDAWYLQDPEFRMLAARAIYQGVVPFFA